MESNSLSISRSLTQLESSVLVREEDGKQLPVYYMSKSLLDVETRYSQLEKLVLALVSTTRKLWPYFQCHPIVVITTYPLKGILQKPELSGRLPSGR